MKIHEIIIHDRADYYGSIFCESENTDRILSLFPTLEKSVQDAGDWYCSPGSRFIKALCFKESTFSCIYASEQNSKPLFYSTWFKSTPVDCTQELQDTSLPNYFEKLKQEQFLSLPDPQKQEMEDELAMEELINKNMSVPDQLKSRLLDSTGAQPLSSKIKTSDGWGKMGEMKTGDDVTASDGHSVKITDFGAQNETGRALNHDPVQAFMDLHERMNRLGLTLTHEQENKLLHDIVNELQEEVVKLRSIIETNQYDLKA